MHAIIKTLSLHSFSSNQCSIEILGEIELCGSDGRRPKCPIMPTASCKLSDTKPFQQEFKGVVIPWKKLVYPVFP